MLQLGYNSFFPFFYIQQQPGHWWLVTFPLRNSGRETHLTDFDCLDRQKSSVVASFGGSWNPRSWHFWSKKSFAAFDLSEKHRSQATRNANLEATAGTQKTPGTAVGQGWMMMIVLFYKWWTISINGAVDNFIIVMICSFSFVFNDSLGHGGFSGPTPKWQLGKWRSFFFLVWS